MSKNPAAKSRKKDNPYVIVCDHLSGWTWKVLKFWQADGTKPYGRAFCDVSSPMTYGDGDLGDVYVTILTTLALRGRATIYSDDLTPDQIATLLGLGRVAMPTVRPISAFTD